MTEKVNALCKAIDTINHLPGCENNDKAVDELVALLLAECKYLCERPPAPSQAAKAKILESFGVIPLDVKAPTTRSAQAEDVYSAQVAESESWIADHFR